MDKICSIKYVDAYYIYEEDIEKTKLSVFEAHGYVEEREDTIIITFIRKRVSDDNIPLNDDPDVVKGLVIPRNALVSVVENYHTDILNNIRENLVIGVTWRDILYVANLPRRDCSIMHTKGSVFKIEKDHIVLKNPETIRTYPTPVRNHPEDGHPTYLIIPISFISKIELIHT